MSLKDRARGWLGAASAGLGVTRWGRVLAAMGVVAVLSLALGCWLGLRWERGVQAIADSKVQKHQIKQLQGQVVDLVGAAHDIKQGAVDERADFRAALGRLEKIADGYDARARTQQAFADSQQAELARLRAARPDLERCVLDDELLEHWNNSNRGRAQPAAAPAGAGHSGASARGVPAAPAGAGRPAVHGDGQSRPGGAGVARLQRPTVSTRRSRARGRRYELAVVLPGGDRGGLQGSRL